MKHQSIEHLKDSTELVGKLAEEFIERYRQGESPEVAEYVERFPQCAADIRELFPTLALMEKVGPSEAVDSGKKALRSTGPKRIGDFRIIREVGRGGMGVVYEAEQVSLGRRVALKVLPQQSLADSKYKRRFIREAKAAARLHHTNIVPVFGVGEKDGISFYVMQFIRGLGLDDVLLELKQLREESLAGRQEARKVQAEHADAAVPVEAEQGALAVTGVHEITATHVAHSLLSGQFEQTWLVNSDSAVRGDAETPAADLETGNGRSESSRSSSLSAAMRDTAVGLISDTERGSGSFAFPGQSENHSTAHSRAVYWKSVARIGVQAAEALAYAHRQGIIHRDVKPGNLLLDTHGTIWVTDFGLAKSDDQQDLTHTGDVLGTLRYMAPEQFDGKADARSDLYSLGLTLYELFALQPAFDERERHKLIKQVTTGTPARLRAVDAHIPRDLETIIQKSIDRDPSHRYQSAQDLADDLSRWLNDEPIRARWVSPLRRFTRWCKRNPAIAALTTAVAVLLMAAAVGGTLVAAEQVRLRSKADQASQNEIAAAEDARRQKAEADRQRAEAVRLGQLAQIRAEEAARQQKRAEENLSKAREAVDRLFTKAAEDLQGEPHMELIRRELLEDALEFYQGFLEQKSDDPEIRLGTAQAYRRVGEIHGALGQSEQKIEAYRSDYKILSQLQADFPRNTHYRQELAESCNHLARALMYSNQPEEGKRYKEQELVIWTRLVADYPLSPDYRQRVVRWYFDQGDQLIVRYRRYADAENLIRRGLAELEHCDTDFPNLPNDDWLHRLGFQLLGKVLFFSGYQATVEEAEQSFRQAIKLGEEYARRIGGKAPTHYHNNYYLSALALLRNAPETAESLIRPSVRQYESQVMQYPHLVGPKRELDKNLDRLLDVLISTDRLQEAMEVGMRRVELDREFVTDSRVARIYLAWAHYELANVFVLTGDRQHAADNYRDAFKLLEELAAESPDVARHVGHLSQALAGCPMTQFRDPQRAVVLAKHALQLTPGNAEYWCRLGAAEYVAQNYPAAIQAYEQAQQDSRAKLKEDDDILLILAHWKSGDQERGRRLFEEHVRNHEENRNNVWYIAHYREFRAEADRLIGPVGGDDPQDVQTQQKPPATDLPEEIGDAGETEEN